MKFNSIKEFIKDPEIYKYVIVGVSNAVFVILLTILFTSVIGVFYLISAIIAYEISIVVSFFMHDKWTFGKVKKTSRSVTRFIKYNTFSLMGLGINSVVLVILTQQFSIHYAISELIAIFVAFTFNYIMNKKISFKN